MLEQIQGKRANMLVINADIGCLLKDSENIFDSGKMITLNCGTYIASGEMNAKLTAAGAVINSDRSLIRDIESPIVQLKGRTDVGRGGNYAGQFVVASGDVVLLEDGKNAFREADQAAVSGTLYYPESSDINAFAKVIGNKTAYPDGARVFLGNQSMEAIERVVSEKEALVWVSGEVKALEEKSLAYARENGIRVICKTLFFREGLKTYGDIFEAGERVLIPDDYEMTGSLELTEGTAALYGPKIYVKGELVLEKQSAGCLAELESIIVRGRARLPAYAVKAFRAVGKAESYDIVEENVHTVNGFEIVGHEELRAIIKTGGSAAFKVNGFLLFDENVTAEDMEAIASISINGAAVMPGAALGALGSRKGSVNGFIGDLDSVKKTMGMTLEEIVENGYQNSGIATINTDIYLLM